MRPHNLRSPSFLGLEVNKAVFACVCLEKGGFLDFSHLSLYRIFSNLSNVFTIRGTILLSKFLFKQSWASKDVSEKLIFPKQTQAKTGLITSRKFLTQRWSAPFYRYRGFSQKFEFIRERDAGHKLCEILKIMEKHI